MSTSDFVRVFRALADADPGDGGAGGLVATHLAAPTKRVFAATSLAYVGREAGGMRNQVTRGNLFRKRRVSTYANLPGADHDRLHHRSRS